MISYVKIAAGADAAGKSWGTRIRTYDKSALAGSKTGEDAQKDAHDPDLQVVVASWNSLPPALRAAVLAIVHAGGTSSGP